MTSQHAIPALPRAGRWVLAVGVSLMALLGVLLAVLLALATDNHLVYERHYPWLLTANVLVAALLLGLLLWGGTRLVLHIRRGRFGARLLLKLSGIFALVGLLPGLLIYTVSYQFAARSIENWFDTRVEGALTAGMHLAHTTLQAAADDMANKTYLAGMQIAGASDAAAALLLERIREQLGAEDLVLWDASPDSGARRDGSGLRAVASAGRSRFDLHPQRPSAALLRALRQKPASASIAALGETALLGDGNLAAARVHTLALVPNPGFGLRQRRYLQATLPLPAALVHDARAVLAAHREYQERARAHTGLRRMYIGTLTLSLFLAVCGAVLLATVLGHQLAQPLLLLARGMRDVARGDLRERQSLQSRDELGGLTRSFARMTRQLAQARATVQSGLAQLDAARAKLQTIVDNLSSGVIVLDATGRIALSNPGAAHILRVSLDAHAGQMLAQVPGLHGLGAVVQEQFAQFFSAPELSARGRWQQVYALQTQGDGQGGGQGDVMPEASARRADADADVEQHTTTLLLRGAQLPDAQRLLVFDDISEIVSAQRTRAWGDVARRVAHEIKNPLTPIQLSAQRLGLRLAGKLPPAEQALLAKSVNTIVEQVAAMKNLVDEFRAFARLPAAQLQTLDLNALVTDVLHLYEDASVRVECALQAQCPPIAGDKEQLRQVLHNLLQNALHASAQRAADSGQSPGPVRVQTLWRPGSAPRVLLTVSDSGPGFAPHILQRAFEPYVTTKARGTGLGLAVVKKIADEHGARIQLGNRVDSSRADSTAIAGAQVSLSFAPEGAAQH